MREHMCFRTVSVSEACLAPAISDITELPRLSWGLWAGLAPVPNGDLRLACVRGQHLRKHSLRGQSLPLYYSSKCWMLMNIKEKKPEMLFGVQFEVLSFFHR